MRTIGIVLYDESWHQSKDGKRPAIWTGRYQLTLVEALPNGLRRLERTYTDLLDTAVTKGGNFLMGLYNPWGS